MKGLSWNRVVTNYNSDVILAGIGCLFLGRSGTNSVDIAHSAVIPSSGVRDNGERGILGEKRVHRKPCGRRPSRREGNPIDRIDHKRRFGMIRSSVVLLAVMMGFSLIGTPPALADGPEGKTPDPSKPYSWTGAYMGVNAGYGFGGNNSVDLGPGDSNFAPVFLAGAVPLPGNLNPGGFVGGGQAGYNYRLEKHWVAGLEVDFQYANLRDSETSATSPPPAGWAPGITTVHQNVSWLGTVRPRMGRLITDRLLLYGTGGFAYADVDRSASIGYPLGGNLLPGVTGQQYYGASSGTKTGWTYGGGLEWAFANKLSLKAEYLYYDLGSETIAVTPYFAGSPPGLVFARFHAMGQIVRTGLNYRF
jgi:outer membrane immunogenic protein